MANKVGEAVMLKVGHKGLHLIGWKAEGELRVLFVELACFVIPLAEL